MVKVKTIVPNTVDLYKYENELYKSGISYIAGVDEVGRGPLYGPVVAASVILPRNFVLVGLDDSKKLTDKKRKEYYSIIMDKAIAIGVGIISSDIIDSVNIYKATQLAMYDSISKLSVKPEHVLIDAMPLDNLHMDSTSIIKGDQLSISIAAASVIAKVIRDEMLDEEHFKHPEYGFNTHKGYGTKKHIEALNKYGVLDNHRRSFSPVKDKLEERNK